MQKIALASNNKGKLYEFDSLFTPLKIKLIPQSTLKVPECDEPFTTFVENAIHKARHCSKHTGLPAIADDSGICVPSLNGSPGVYSARYAGTHGDDAQNIEKLLEAIKPHENREAYFYCVLVFLRHAADPQPIIADGTVHGQITFSARGNNGFGYDPIFYLPEYTQTFAEVPLELKNKISHRAIALSKLINQLQKEFYYAT